MTPIIQICTLTANARALTSGAMKSLISEFASLSDDELRHVEMTFREELESVGHQMAEPHFLHEAAMREIRCRATAKSDRRPYIIAGKAMKKLMEHVRNLPEDELAVLKREIEASRQHQLAEIEFIAGAIDAVERGRQGGAA